MGETLAGLVCIINMYSKQRLRCGSIRRRIQPHEAAGREAHQEA